MVVCCAGPKVDAEMSDLQAALERSFNLTMQVLHPATHPRPRVHPASLTFGVAIGAGLAQGMKAASDIETETANLDRRIKELKGELKK